jgi:hypothetical protein
VITHITRKRFRYGAPTGVHTPIYLWPTSKCHLALDPRHDDDTLALVLFVHTYTAQYGYAPHAGAIATARGMSYAGVIPRLRQLMTDGVIEVKTFVAVQRCTAADAWAFS